jgi:hypothetical protein
MTWRGAQGLIRRFVFWKDAHTSMGFHNIGGMVEYDQAIIRREGSLIPDVSLNVNHMLLPARACEWIHELLLDHAVAIVREIEHHRRQEREEASDGWSPRE